MSVGTGARFVKFLKDNSLPVTMVSLLVVGHIGWRQLQEQEQFVPKGTAKDYPWFEIARHYKSSQKSEAKSE